MSVERLKQPDLVGKPVVVGAKPGTRGVVSAASYEVREFGVRSGMPIAEAYRRAPHAVYVSGRHSDYGEYSSQVKTILERFCPVVRAASIDEFFLDFNGCETLYRKPDDFDDDFTIERTVREMRIAIQTELGLPASAGIGTHRSIAKIASGSAKPAGVLMIRAGEEFDFVAEMSVRRWPGIGPAAEEKLRSYGIKTLGQLLQSGIPQSEPVRKVVFGESGASLGRNRPAFREHDPDGLTLGSISNECTFAADVGESQKIWDQLRALSERVCWRMRQRSIQARTITLKLRYSNFETLTRARTIKPTDSERTVFDCVSQLLSQNYDSNRRLRLLGVCLSNLTESERQLQLPFDNEQEDASQVGQAIDEVRDKFGYDAIHFGKKTNSRWNR